jgi:hypothetical protein
MTELEEQRSNSEELLDEESLAVLAILLAVSLEFGFGFAKTVDWWAGLAGGPATLATLVALFRLRPTHVWLVRIARWIVRPRSDDSSRQRPCPPMRLAGERQVVPASAHA